MRNHLHELRSLPGGVAGLAAVIAQLHAANVTVYLPWNYWGNTTGRRADDDFVELLAEVNADGFNADTGRSRVCRLNRLRARTTSTGEQ